MAKTEYCLINAKTAATLNVLLFRTIHEGKKPHFPFLCPVCGELLSQVSKTKVGKTNHKRRAHFRHAPEIKTKCPGPTSWRPMW
jgi:hypothetical protein